VVGDRWWVGGMEDEGGLKAKEEGLRAKEVD
jgi:hypothetical protein